MGNGDLLLATTFVPDRIKWLVPNNLQMIISHCKKWTNIWVYVCLKIVDWLVVCFAIWKISKSNLNIVASSQNSWTIKVLLTKPPTRFTNRFTNFNCLSRWQGSLWPWSTWKIYVSAYQPMFVRMETTVFWKTKKHKQAITTPKKKEQVRLTKVVSTCFNPSDHGFSLLLPSNTSGPPVASSSEESERSERSPKSSSLRSSMLETGFSVQFIWFYTGKQSVIGECIEWTDQLFLLFHESQNSTRS